MPYLYYVCTFFFFLFFLFLLHTIGQLPLANRESERGGGGRREKESFVCVTSQNELMINWGVFFMSIAGL